MEINYHEINQTKSSISYLILDSNNQQIGSAEGHVGHEELITVIKINPEHQKKGIGFKAFNKIYTELCLKTQISIIAGSWHKDEEFLYCENGMSTNLSLFHDNLKAGLSKEESAFNTPTGKWAQRIGYNKCEIKGMTSNDVYVTFYK